METITFYSYKGGTGRSLALANAAVYLAKLGFNVVALDFDLEAPGLHYKLSRNKNGSPLHVEKGVVDYVAAFLAEGEVRLPLKHFMVHVTVPGIEKSHVHLIPAGQVPSAEYWSKLSRINWHELFYKKGAKGVQIFKELQTRISDELRPDFLLVDSRTGITEMGGVATTLLADKVLCMVSPTLENLEGARAVLRSLNRARRERSRGEHEIILAVSRLPEQRGSSMEQDVTSRILEVMNQPATDARDTLALKGVFVLHSEAALQVEEALRVGGGINPDESILLRDYLRLFASFVPKESIEPKVHDLIEKAWDKLRIDPDAAIKEMEELAESFAHPENYRELLRFYRARNADSMLIMRRAQRLWEITGDSYDMYLWEVVSRYFDPAAAFQREKKEWSPNLSFVRAVWQAAGGRQREFGRKLAEAFSTEDEDGNAADVLDEIIKTAGPSPSLVAQSVLYLDYARRSDQSNALIERYRVEFAGDSDFASSWARHSLWRGDSPSLMELANSPAIKQLRASTAAQVYFKAGYVEQATSLTDAVFKDVRHREVPTYELNGLGRMFRDMGRWPEFEKIVGEAYPRDVLVDLRESLGLSPSQRRSG